MADDPIDPDVLYGDPNRALRSIATDALAPSRGAPIGTFPTETNWGVMDRPDQDFHTAYNTELFRQIDRGSRGYNAGGVPDTVANVWSASPAKERATALRTAMMNPGVRYGGGYIGYGSNAMGPAPRVPEFAPSARPAWADALAFPSLPDRVIAQQGVDAFEPMPMTAATARGIPREGLPPGANVEAHVGPTIRPPMLTDRNARILLGNANTTEANARRRILDDLYTAEKRIHAAGFTVPERTRALERIWNIRNDVVAGRGADQVGGASRRAVNVLADLGLDTSLPSRGDAVDPEWRVVLPPERAVAPIGAIPAWAAALMGGAHLEGARGMVDDASMTGAEGVPAWAQAAGGGGGPAARMEPTRD